MLIREHPHLFEVHARVFLDRLSRKYNQSLTLATIPDAEWQKLSKQGFDLVWLMGVWQRSPKARQLALTHPNLRRAYDQLTPGWKEADIDGSPYAIFSYTLDPHLGKEGDLAELKNKLNRLGLGLMLDFVPNHLAFDHPWTKTHPKRFVCATKEVREAHPDWFFSPDPVCHPERSEGSTVEILRSRKPLPQDDKKKATRDQKTFLAHGRDPHFGPWTDTVQVNFFSEEMRQALYGELEKIAKVTDALRCDMAMLGLHKIFGKVWGDCVKEFPIPRTEFWPEIIRKIKAAHPGFIFLAEVYWDLEWELQQMGFDFTYDKRLYDRLKGAPVKDIRGHLRAEALFQKRSARFIENHDEPRAAEFFGEERSLAAAAVMTTVPGMRFFYDGQLTGKKIHGPIQLLKEPEEGENPRVKEFYSGLLRIINAEIFHGGTWRLLELTEANPGNETHRNILAWEWVSGRRVKVVVVNYSEISSQGRLFLSAPPLASRKHLVLHEELTDQSYGCHAEEGMPKPCFSLDLMPWDVQIFEVS